MTVRKKTFIDTYVLAANKTLVGGLALALFSILLIWMLLPHIGVRDGDAHAYIVGAYSFQSGNGYVTLDGTKINRWWPPGYSLLLSLFPQPLSASMLINYMALGGSVALCYAIAVVRGWDRRIAASFALVLGFGFFRQLGTAAKPDILVYAFFLIGLYLYVSESRGLHFASFFLWSAMIPFKLVAAVFTPAAVIADFLAVGKSFWLSREYWMRLAAIGLGWAAFLGSLFLFNYATLGAFMVSHGKNSMNLFFQEVLQFFVSVSRTLLVPWYGSIKDPWILMAFLLSLAISVSCLASLRPDPRSKHLLTFGALILLMSWALQIVSTFDADARNMGYGLLVIVFALRPVPSAWRRWSAYALIMICMAVLNLNLVNAYGINDPRYRTMSYELLDAGLPQGPIYTNSFHLLDVHVKIPTEPIESLAELDDDVTFLLVNLPRYDAIATVVWPIERPGSDWCEIRAVEGATLFQKCQP